MFARSYRIRPFGRQLEVDLYAPRCGLDRQGLALHADTVLVVRRNYRDWKWVVGVKVFGIGLAVASPK